MKELNILFITASIREGRQSPKVSSVLIPLFQKKSGVIVNVIDLQTLNLPMFTDADPSGPALTIIEAYKKADGIVIVTPEYNHSIPSVLKNAIDFAVEKELYGKPLATVGVSSGPFAGVRAIKELAHVWHGSGGIALPVFLPTPKVEEFDSANPPEDWSKRAEVFIEKTVYWFRVIKEGKEIVK